jgi:hypothetical protein
MGAPFEEIQETFKRAVAALREAEVPFALAGSVAAWARGGPEAAKDLDIIVTPDEADRAARVLAEAGMRGEDPPEEWLLKAWDGDVLIDLMFAPKGVDAAEAIAASQPLSVLAVEVPVIRLEDLLTSKLLALTEQNLDFGGLFAISRAVREQIDWDEVRSRTWESPYARGFFTMLEALGMIAAPAERSASPVAEIRVEDAPARVGG